jgi:hypothetical protein
MSGSSRLSESSGSFCLFYLKIKTDVREGEGEGVREGRELIQKNFLPLGVVGHP